jgi:hypothetical protein
MVNRKDKEPNINNYKCDYYEKDMEIAEQMVNTAMMLNVVLSVLSH